LNFSEPAGVSGAGGLCEAAEYAGIDEKGIEIPRGEDWEEGETGCSPLLSRLVERNALGL
jgi:hypothetical protein